eukprot:1671553-Pyramimonas_sp.AAC.1
MPAVVLYAIPPPPTSWHVTRVQVGMWARIPSCIPTFLHGLKRAVLIFGGSESASCAQPNLSARQRGCPPNVTEIRAAG